MAFEVLVETSHKHIRMLCGIFIDFLCFGILLCVFLKLIGFVCCFPVARDLWNQRPFCSWSDLIDSTHPRGQSCEKRVLPQFMRFGFVFIPIPSMYGLYGIFTYIWWFLLMVNVGIPCMDGMSRGEHCQLACSILDGTRHGELDIRYIKEAIHQGPGEPQKPWWLFDP